MITEKKDGQMVVMLIMGIMMARVRARLGEVHNHQETLNVVVVPVTKYRSQIARFRSLFSSRHTGPSIPPRFMDNASFQTHSGTMKFWFPKWQSPFTVGESQTEL